MSVLDVSWSSEVDEQEENSMGSPSKNFYKRGEQKVEDLEPFLEKVRSQKVKTKKQKKNQI